MDEKIIKEPVEGEPGVVETPIQPTSEPPVEPSAVDEASLKAILEPLVRAEYDLRAQSIKDKRIAIQEGRITGIEDTLAQLKELQADGMSEKQAIQYVKMEELLASQGQTSPTEAPPAEVPAEQPAVAVGDYLSPILKMAGIDANDPEVITMLRDERDPIKQINAVTALAEARKQTTPPNPAAVLPSGGGKAVPTETLESVTAELQAELAKPSTPATRVRIQELGKKSKELLPKQ